MADNTVEINITADIIEAQTSLGVLKQKLKDLVKTQQESLDQFDERSDKMTEAQRKSFEAFQNHLTNSIEKVKKSITGCIEKIDELKGEDLGTGLKDNVEKTSGAFSHFGNVLKTAFVYDVAFQAINKLESALKGLLTSSIEMSGQFEQMQIGIAAVISASSSNVSSTGVSINSTQKFAMAQKDAAEAMQALKKANLQTVATLPEITEAFQATLAPARRLGLTINDTVGFTKDMANAAASIGMPMSQLSQEIRAVLEGDTSKNSRVNQILQIKPATIEAHRAAGDLADYLKMRLSDYAASGEAMSQSWVGIKSNVMDALLNIETEASKDIFADLKNNGLGLQKTLTDNMNSIGEKIRSTVDKIYDYFHSLYVSTKTIFEALSPIIDTLGITLLGVAQIVKGAFATIAVSLTMTKAGFSELWEVVKFTADSIGNTILMLSNTFQHALNGDFTGAKKAWTDYKNSIVNNASDLSKKVSSINQEMINKNKEVARALWKTTTPPKEKKIGDGNKGNGDLVSNKDNGDDKKKKKEKGMANEMALFEEELNKQKIDHDLAIQDEIDFWKKKEKLAKDGTELKAQIIAKEASLSERKRAEDKRANDQGLKDSQKISIDKIQTEETSSLIILENEKASNELRFKNGEITNNQRLENLVKIENAMFAVKSDSLKKERALYGEGTKDYTGYTKKIEDLKLAQVKAINSLNVKQAATEAQYFKNTGSVIENSFGKAIESMIMKTKTFGQAIRGMASSIISGFASMIAQMIAKWSIMELTKLAISKGFMSAKLAVDLGLATAETAAAATAQAAQAPAKAAQATGLVAMAAMGSFASQSAIPIVGPALGAAAMASTTAALSPLIPVASAAGGFDIPSGINPVTQLHQEEMVLPAHIANPLRESLANGGSNAGMNVTIHAVDAKSVKQLFMDHGSSLADSLKHQRRNFKA